MFKKYNFVVILPDDSRLNEINLLSKYTTSVMFASDGRAAVIGRFAEKDIAEFQHYPANSDWQEIAHFEDQSL